MSLTDEAIEATKTAVREVVREDVIFEVSGAEQRLSDEIRSAERRLEEKTYAGEQRLSEKISRNISRLQIPCKKSKKTPRVAEGKRP